MKKEERRCLEDLCNGQDAWGEFWRLFGYVIASEVYQFKYCDTSLVDDFYQDLCIKLMRNQHSAIRRYLANPFRSSFASYIRKVTKHMLIDYSRKHARTAVVEPDQLDSAAARPSPRSWNADPDLKYANETKLKQILLDVAGGNPESENYQMLYLRFFEGERVKVIAERFGMKQNTVAKRLLFYVEKVYERHRYSLMDISDEG